MRSAGEAKSGQEHPQIYDQFDECVDGWNKVVAALTVALTRHPRRRRCGGKPVCVDLCWDARATGARTSGAAPSRRSNQMSLRYGRQRHLRLGEDRLDGLVSESIGVSANQLYRRNKYQGGHDLRRYPYSLLRPPSTRGPCCCAPGSLSSSTKGP